MEDLLNMSNKQLTELINQAEQIREERLKQEKKNIIKDLRDIVSRAEEFGIRFVKENPSCLPTFYNTINILDSSDEVIYLDFQQNH
jgi:hypothetical protein